MEFNKEDIVMNFWKRSALVATLLVASIPFYGQAASQNTMSTTSQAVTTSYISDGAVEVLGHKGAITVPRDVTIRRLSDTVLVPVFAEFIEKGLQEDIARGPQLRSWEDNKLLIGEEREASLKAYERQQKQLRYMNDYRLGEKADVYQWQLKDSDGRKTATVFGLVLTPETTKGLSNLAHKEFIDSQLPALNAQWLQSDGKLYKKVQELAMNSGASAFAYTKAELKDQTPWARLPHSTHPAYMASTRFFAGANGLELPYYLQGAVVLTEPNPVAYVLVTSDVEKEVFAPRFVQFIQEL